MALIDARHVGGACIHIGRLARRRRETIVFVLDLDGTNSFANQATQYILYANQWGNLQDVSFSQGQAVQVLPDAVRKEVASAVSRVRGDQFPSLPREQRGVGPLFLAPLAFAERRECE